MLTSSAGRPVWKCWKLFLPPLFRPCNYNMCCLRMAKLMCSSLFKLVFTKNWIDLQKDQNDFKDSSLKVETLGVTSKLKKDRQPQYRTENPTQTPGSRITSVATIILNWCILCFGVAGHLSNNGSLPTLWAFGQRSHWTWPSHGWVEAALHHPKPRQYRKKGGAKMRMKMMKMMMMMMMMMVMMLLMMMIMMMMMK